MRLMIIRHGDPNYEIDSLTEKGWREADLLADKLQNEQMDYIYCSTHGRAMDTAKETLRRTGKSAEYCDWLREISYMRVNDPENPGKDRAMWDFMPRFYTNNDMMHSKDDWMNSELVKGTDIPKLYKNMTDNLDAVLEKHSYKRHKNMYVTDCGNHDTVVFFCHLGAESVILSHLLNTSPFIFLQSFFVAPTSVTTLITEERKKGEVAFRCQSLGDVSHLYAKGEPPAFSGRFCECFEDDTRH